MIRAASHSFHNSTWQLLINLCLFLFLHMNLMRNVQAIDYSVMRQLHELFFSSLAVSVENPIRLTYGFISGDEENMLWYWSASCCVVWSDDSCCFPLSWRTTDAVSMLFATTNIIINAHRNAPVTDMNESSNHVSWGGVWHYWCRWSDVHFSKQINTLDKNIIDKKLPACNSHHFTV